MNFQEIAGSRLIENLGWTLLHSLWQIALAALWLFLARKALAKHAASLRYAVSLAAFAVMLILPLMTFTFLSRNSSASVSNPVTSDIKNDRFFGGHEPIAEESDAVKNKAADAPVEIFFVSAEELQNDFGRKVSALAPFLVGFWLCGVLTLSVRLAGGAWQLRIYRTRAVSTPGEEWQLRFAELRRKLGIRQPVELLQSKIIETPMVVGWLKPVVLVPAAVFLRLKTRELETVLAHELWHVRRFDYAINFVQSLIEILFFYHPLARQVSAAVRRERELACDEAVIRILENSALVYANALASLEEFRLDTKQNAPLVTAAHGGNLMNRIERILNKNAETGGKAGASLWSASLALTLISALSLIVFSAGETLSVNAGAANFGAPERKMAIGFVSIPPNDRTANPPKDADATARLLIEKLKSHRIPAIGFLQGGSVSDGEKLFPVRAEIVRLWRDAGFEIGIGGFRHVWFYHTPYADYVAGVEKNERIARQILAEKNLPLRYFSYPFLNTGKTAADRNRFEAWLKERGLTPVKYTFDNQEWMYSYAYDAARERNDANAMRQIRAEFVDYMAKMLDHYEAYSREMFGRDINQTMVLTPSRLVADSADELFGMIEKRGYRFVSMDEALRDAAYQTPEAHVESQSGISWFERWRMAQGGNLRSEPPVSPAISKIWEERNKK